MNDQSGFWVITWGASWSFWCTPSIVFHPIVYCDFVQSRKVKAFSLLSLLWSLIRLLWAIRSLNFCLVSEHKISCERSDHTQYVLWVIRASFEQSHAWQPVILVHTPYAYCIVTCSQALNIEYFFVFCLVWSLMIFMSSQKLGSKSSMSDQKICYEWSYHISNTGLHPQLGM